MSSTLSDVNVIFKGFEVTIENSLIIVMKFQRFIFGS